MQLKATVKNAKDLRGSQIREEEVCACESVCVCVCVCVFALVHAVEIQTEICFKEDMSGLIGKSELESKFISPSPFGRSI